VALIATTLAIRLCLRTSRFCQAKLGSLATRVAVPALVLAVFALAGTRVAWPQSVSRRFMGQIAVSMKQFAVFHI